MGVRLVFNAKWLLATYTAAAAVSLGAAGGLQAAPVAHVERTGFDLALSLSAATTDGVKRAGIVAGWTHPAPLWQGRRWHVDLRHELVLASWHVPQAQNLMEYGYSPVLRLVRPSGASGAFFAEASIGVHGLTRTRISADRNLSSKLQFADMLGAGWQWGPARRSTLGLRFQHISDAGLKRPNPGINFTQLYYSHRF